MNPTIRERQPNASKLLGPIIVASVGLMAFSVVGCVARKTVAARPNLQTPANWTTEVKNISATASEDLSKWWHRLGDDTLTNLIEQALKNNPDVRSARSRLREARAQRNFARIMQVPFVFNPQINVLAFVVSGAIGVIFGYLPAKRAARLDPMKALRHE